MYLSTLSADYSLDDKWPSIGTHILGAVSSVKLDFNKNIVIFHRGDHVWNAASFDPQTNIYTQKNIGPIAVPTILTLDRTSGEIIHGWGENNNNHS